MKARHGRDDVLGILLRTLDDDGAPISDGELCDAMRTLLLAGTMIVPYPDTL